MIPSYWSVPLYCLS